VETALIYDTGASFTHHLKAPDRTHPALAPPTDDVNPMWGIYLHHVSTGLDGSHTIAHSTLEWMCSWNGFDPDELPAIVDTAIHAAHIPDADDALAWLDPAKLRLMTAIHQDLPDPMDPRMPYGERREVMLARTAAIKENALRVEAAPWEDRAGALYARAVAVRETEAALAEHGYELPAQFMLGLDDEAPEDPLEPILSSRLDPARVASRRLRDEWIQDRQDASVQRALVAMRSPMTYGVVLKMPPSASALLDGLKPKTGGRRGH